MPFALQMAFFQLNLSEIIRDLHYNAYLLLSFRLV